MPPKQVQIAETSNRDDEDAASVESFIAEEPDEVVVTKQKVQRFKFFRYVRIAILFCIWFTSLTILFITDEYKSDWKSTFVPVRSEGKEYPIKEQPASKQLTIYLRGPFLYKFADSLGRESVKQPNIIIHNEVAANFLVIDVRRRFEAGTQVETVSKAISYQMVEPGQYDTARRIARSSTFDLEPSSAGGEFFYNLSLQGTQTPLPLEVQTFPTATATPVSLALSIAIVVGLYMMLFWDITSRAIIGIMMCTLSVALLSLSSLRPPLPLLVQFVDIDYVLLLFGLTIIFGVLAETGADVSMAVHVYRYSNGHVWPLLTVLCAITFVGSIILDHLTVLVLTTLFTLRICEVAQLNPAHVLTCLIVFSNTGNMLGPSAKVDNLLVAHSIAGLEHYHHGYPKYMVHMIIPIVASAALTYGFLRLFYRGTVAMQNEEAPIVSRLKHAIRFWSHTAKSLGDYSEAEKAVHLKVQQKVSRLRDRLKRLGKMPVPPEDFNEKMRRLKEGTQIKNKPQMIMCLVILSLVVVMQFLHNFNLILLSEGFICLLFSLVLLALTDWNDFESLMHRVDWSTIIFIACFMIFTRALAPLGFTDEISKLVVHKISKLDGSYRLQVGSIILIAVSTLCSALFDTEYIRELITSRIIDLRELSTDRRLDLEPLLLSVLLGSGFGCNLTLISAFTNIVCAGLAEKHDYKFYFWDYFKVGAVVTLINTVLSMAYINLLILVLGY